MIEIGSRIPDLTLRIKDDQGARSVQTGELFAGKKAVLFAVPGAFTPTCSDVHLPGYVEHASELKARGVELIACTAVNDPDVMLAWGKVRGAGDAVLMLPDGNGELARALGLSIDLTKAGMGERSRRYAMLLEDGIVKAIQVEPGPGVNVSGAEHMLALLG